MPEIKHTFTGGKMNKDHDERLIKSGEYRDAMNIQVTTSEGSDVGTMQNVLGNAGVCTNLGCIPDNSYTVGSISDEKNDTLYWLVAGGAFSDLQQHLYDAYSNTYSASTAVGDVLYSKDLIMRKTPNGCEPVFVDIYGFALANSESVLGDGNAAEGVTNTLVIPIEYDNGKPLLSQIEVGMTVHGLDDTLTPNTSTANVISVGALKKIDTVYTPNTYTCQGAVLTPGGGVDFDGDYSGSGGFEIDYSVAGSAGTWAVGDAIPITGRLIVNASAFDQISNYLLSTYGAEQVPTPTTPQVGDRISVTNPAVGGTNIVVSHALITDIEDVNFGGSVGGDYKIITVDQPVSNWAGAASFSANGQGMINGEANAYNFDINLVADGNVTPMPPLDTMAFTSGTMLTVDRSGTCFRPYIDLPSNSPWLDEIYNVFFNNNTSYIQGSEIKIKVNPAWPDASGFGDGWAGCIDWETTYDAGSGFALNGPTTNRLHMAQCDDFSIEVTPTSTYNYLSLVASGDLGQDVVLLDKEIDLGTNTAYFNFQRDRVLNFRADRLITGINVIDDMLFWTDGHTEPKKINIQRSIDGTIPDGSAHTRVVTDVTTTTIPVMEEHITVIKQPPTHPLSMELSTGRKEEHTHTGVMMISTEGSQPSSSFIGGDGTSETTDHYDFSSMNVGDFFNVEIASDIYGGEEFTLRNVDGKPWGPNTKVVFKEFTEDSAPDIPVLQYTIKATVGGWSGNKMEATAGDPAKVSFRVDFIEGSVPSTDSVLKFAIDVFDESEKLFEFKFPRFSYRYKYADGEYSTFAPFTEVAFVPGGFSYHPKKGYNLGMTNRIKTVTIKDFVTPLTPSDVIAIDILYKDDQSPNIYVVDTVASNDETVNGHNEWQANEYIISSDIIHSILPANQLLRPWDNVPRKAVAQEITKNRLVYANYTQGYDLTVGGKNIKPQFKHSLVNNKNSIKSIKSLREYQLGVVFIDKYGRETPVITNRSGGFKISKSESSNKNQLKVGLSEMTIPSDMEYFKFFVKETSGEYYNMAMDRWYDADDGSVWLAFPSSDRNKIDEDTFLILKKGVESSSLVKEPAKYKIISIENQAPDFIKTTKYNIGDVQQDGGVGNDSLLYGASMDNAPKRGRNNFSCLASRFNGTSLSQVEEIKEELYVEFYIQGKPNVSHRYKINSASRDKMDDGTLGEDFNFTIDGFFGDDINFILNGTTTSPSSVLSTAKTRFYKGVLENAAKFDGKFFVKIYADEYFNKYIANPPVTDDDRVEYGGIDFKKIYYCSPDHHAVHDGDYGDGAIAFGNNNFIQDAFESVYDNMPSFAVAGNSLLNSSHRNNDLYFTVLTRHLKLMSGMVWWQGGIPDPANSTKPAYQPGSVTANRAFFKNNLVSMWDYKGHSVNDEDGWFDYSIGQSDSYGLKLLWGLQNDLNARGIAEGDHGYEDVFFIDGGPIAGNNSGMNGALNHISYEGEDYNHGNPRTNFGIRNSGTYGEIDLGFGPIMPDKTYPNRGSGGWSWESVWGGDKKDILNWHHGDEKIFDLNRDGSRYEDAGKYLDRLASGKKFHWLEDPTKTIYTLSTATKRNNRTRITGEGDINTYAYSFRYEDWMTNDNNDFWSSRYADRNLIARIAHPHFYTGENFSKSNIGTFKPAMTNWEPTNYENGGVGPIPGGRTIQFHASLATALSATPTETIKSIANSWTNNSFKVSKQHINQAWDSNNGTTLDVDGDDIAGEFTSVVEGMILTHIGSSSITNITTNGEFIKTPLLIDSIVGSGDDYIINIVGYKNVRSTSSNAVGLYSLNSQGTGSDGVFDLTFRQPAMNGLSVNSIKNLNRESFSTEANWIGIGAVGYTLEFLEPVERETLLPKNPSVWETEPKESTDLDIYYEISGKNPVHLNKDTIKLAAPIGSTISVNNQIKTAIIPTVIGYTTVPNKTLVLEPPVCIGALSNCPEGAMPIDIGNDDVTITRPDGSEITARVEDFVEVAGTPGLANKIVLNENISNSSYTLSWHNCYSFGNGVESNRIRDSFNLPYITSGVKASTTLEGEYKEEHRKYGLIYSGIYNSTSGINNLNQFIQAEKITKDVNPVYGSIQKLHTRDSNLIALCEDKILKILAHKDALYNADGNPQLIATDKVLGQTTPFVGEYGISTNPESFASESYRAYFTDKVRGSVMRLSKDGLTSISDAGMKDWFRDNLKLSSKLVGSYDDHKGEYNITLNQTADPDNAKSVTYREDVRGWVSFKSFVPENGLSCANQYYTFKEGDIYQHHLEKDVFDNPVNRNTFYNVHAPSSFNVIFNDQPGVVKSFKTLNYEGSQSKIDENLQDGQYYNLQDKEGWYVSNIETDLEKGSLNEFIRKEGKWFNYIKGKEGVVTNSGVVVGGFDNSDTSFQGIGRVDGNPTASMAGGCTDPTAFNYNPSAVVDAGNCISAVLGCTDSQSETYDSTANTDDGSCNYPGCTNPSAFNYDSSANSNDGSCVGVINGCTDNSMFNYDGAANTDDGSCIAIITGCIDPTADNYNDTANTDDGNCMYTVYGCIDVNACNYDTAANTDDGSCGYCGDSAADNYSANVEDTCTNGCVYCVFNDNSLQSLTTSSNSIIVNDSATSIDIAWSSIAANPGTAPIVSYDVRYSVSGLDTWTVINNVPNNTNIWYQTYTIQGLTHSTAYDIQVRKICNNTASGWSPILTLSTQFAEIWGCTDATACNYDPLANMPDIYNVLCNYTSCAGCMDATASNYDATATIDDGSCIPVVNGCTDNSAFNYDVNANADDGSCIPFIYGCTDADSCNFDPTVNTDDGSCIGACSSFIDSVNISGNFVNDVTLGVYNTEVTVAWDTLTDPDASTGHRIKYKKSSDSGWVLVAGLSAGSGSTVISAIFEENEDYDFRVKAICSGSGCNESWSSITTVNIGAFYGCTDPNATNYVNGATTDDNSCLYLTEGCMYGLADNYDPNASANNLSLCTFTTTAGPGCMDSTQFNYDPNATSDDGDCQPFTYGCINSTASNYNSTVNTSDGSCIWLGCTDATANNYDPTATTDDGSCMY